MQLTTRCKHDTQRRADAFSRRHPKHLAYEYNRELQRRLDVVDRLVHREIEQILSRHGAFLEERARRDSIEPVVDEIRRSLNGVDVALQGTWSDLETREYARSLAQQVDDYETRQTARQWKTVLGVDPFFSDRATTEATKKFAADNLQLITELPREVIAQLNDHLVEAARTGQRPSEFQKIVGERLGVGRSRARLIARDQIGSMSGNINRVRQTGLGITRYRWSTSNDERVRDEHVVRDGLIFSWSEPPEDGHPGQPIQCRCIPDPIISDVL